MKLKLLKKLKDVLITNKPPAGTKVGKQHRPSFDAGEHEVNYRLDNTDDVYYAVKDGKVVGHLGLEDGKVRTVYVDPEARRGGVASELYKKVAKDYGKVESDDLNAMEPAAKKLWRKLKYDSYPEFEVRGGHSNKPFTIEKAKGSASKALLKAGKDSIPIKNQYENIYNSMGKTGQKLFDSLSEFEQKKIMQDSAQKYQSDFARSGYAARKALELSKKAALGAVGVGAMEKAEGSTWLKDTLSKSKKDPEFKYKRTPIFSEKADAWLDENVNQPLAERGMGTLGAGLSAAGSTLASLVDSDTDTVAQAAPGGKALQSITKLEGKVAPRLIEKLKKGKTLTKNETKRLAKAQSKSTKEKYTDTEMPSYSKATEAQRVQMDVDPNVLTYGRDVDKASWGKLVERQGVQPPKSSKK